MKQIIWKTKTFFEKLEYGCLVQSTKIESAIFSHKTALPKANAKTNRMGSTKWTYQKGRNLASNYFVFLKICSRVRTSSKELIRCTNYTNVHIHTFRKRWSFIWKCFFLASILNVKVNVMLCFFNKHITKFWRELRKIFYYCLKT